MDEPHAAHVGRQLIDDVEAARVERQGRLAGVPVSEIEQAKIVRRSRRELGDFEIRPADPVSFLLEAPNEVTRDEPARATHQGLRHRVTTTMIATVLARICAIAPNSAT